MTGSIQRSDVPGGEPAGRLTGLTGPTWMGW